MLNIIADRNASDTDVKVAIHGLGAVLQPSQFWAQIANDQSYSGERRRQCILQLFQRHAHVGMTLKEVAEKLNKPNWLSDKDISWVQPVGGLIPVQIVSGDTIFVLLLLPPSHGNNVGVYLRVSGRVEVKEFGEVLRGKVVTGKVAESRLNEIGF